MGHEIGVRESLYAFLLFRSMRTSKIGDELLVFTDGESVLCLGECVHLSLCICNGNFLQSNAGVLSVSIPGECNFVWG